MAGQKPRKAPRLESDNDAPTAAAAVTGGHDDGLAAQGKGKKKSGRAGGSGDQSAVACVDPHGKTATPTVKAKAAANKDRKKNKNKFKAPCDDDIYYENDAEVDGDDGVGRGLQWRNVEFDPAIFTTTEGMDGFLGLEEIDDCDVLYEDQGDGPVGAQAGRVMKIKASPAAGTVWQ